MAEQAQSDYVVIARRYRPQRFDELLGQQHVGQALAGAIASGRVGHAYLFTGARGVGKTSAARILAKALNCREGPTAEPCNQCEICQSISTGDDVDVLEIDGASNRGIDEIRQLRQNVSVRPSRARLKIYIIDEVHMLTREAFNALLKTLEEPPEHVKFIFCTTEPQKIPITILSRCQRFDFAGISREAITARLAHIVASEGVEADAEALDLLARRAAGSMRDSQSLLEQLLAFGSERINVEEVHRLLGTADEDRLIGLLGHLVERDAAAALAELDVTLGAGVDVALLLEQLLGYLRDVMVLAAGGGEKSILYASPTTVRRIAEASQSLGLSTVLAAMQIIEQTLAKMKQSTQSRVLAELALVRICQLEELDALPELIEQLYSGGPATVAGTRVGPAHGAAQGGVRGSGQGAARQGGYGAASGRASATGAGQPPSPAPPSASKDHDGPPRGKKNDEPSADGPVAESENVATGTAVAEPVTLTDENAEHVWRAALAGLSTTAANHARQFDRVTVAGPGRLVVHFAAAEAFAKTICSHVSHVARFEQALADELGQTVRVEFRADEAPPPADAASPTSAARVSPQQRMREVSKHPMIQRANELFGAVPTRVDDPR